jgi:hypothetical protein
VRHVFFILFFVTFFALAGKSYGDEGVTSWNGDFSTVFTAGYVLSSKQSLIVSCPKDKKVNSASCNSSSRLFSGSMTLIDTASGAALRENFSIVEIIKTVEVGGISQAKCRAQVVRPDEVVKLTMTVKCI